MPKVLSFQQTGKLLVRWQHSVFEDRSFTYFFSFPRRNRYPVHMVQIYGNRRTMGPQNNGEMEDEYG